jgi:hypothetical protein
VNASPAPPEARAPEPAYDHVVNRGVVGAYGGASDPASDQSTAVAGHVGSFPGSFPGSAAFAHAQAPAAPAAPVAKPTFMIPAAVPAAPEASGRADAGTDAGADAGAGAGAASAASARGALLRIRLLAAPRRANAGGRRVRVVRRGRVRRGLLSDLRRGRILRRRGTRRIVFFLFLPCGRVGGRPAFARRESRLDGGGFGWFGPGTPRGSFRGVLGVRLKLHRRRRGHAPLAARPPAVRGAELRVRRPARRERARVPGRVRRRKRRRGGIRLRVLRRAAGSRARPLPVGASARRRAGRGAKGREGSRRFVPGRARRSRLGEGEGEGDVPAAHQSQPERLEPSAVRGGNRFANQKRRKRRGD